MTLGTADPHLERSWSPGGQPCAESDLLARIMEISPVGIAVINRDGRIAYANAKAGRVLGLAQDRITQLHYNSPEWQVTDYEGQPFPEDELPFQRVLQTGRAVQDVRHAIVCPDGQKKLLSISATPILDESGQVDTVVAAIEDVTDRIQVERALRRSEDYYRRLLESVNDAVFLRPITPDGFFGRFVDFNGVACEWLGYSREELMQKSPMDIDPDSTAEQIEARDKELLARGSIIFQTTVQTKAGRRIPVEISSHRFEWGGRQMMLSIARDLTERQAAEAALRQSEERYRLLADNMADVLWKFDLQSRRFLFISPSVRWLRGYTVEEAMAQSMEEMLTEQSLTLVNKMIQDRLKAYQAGDPSAVTQVHEVQLTRKEDAPVWTEMVTTILPNESAGISVVGVSRDITKRKEMEEALRKSEGRFRSIFTNAPVGIFQSTVDRLLVVNPPLARIFGYESPAEMLAGTASPEAFFVWSGQRRQILREAMESKTYAEQEVEYRRKDGSTFTANLRLRTVSDQAGNVKNFEGFVEDVSERKQTEDDLLKMSRALEQSPVTIVITDPAGNIEYVNPKFTQMTGYTKEEALGKNPRILKSGRMAPEEYKRMWAAITTGHEWRGEFMNKARDGKLFWESVVISPVLSKTGQITHFLAVKEDITQKKHLEEQLRQAQKMEAIGQLAGGVAHDFNNILAATLLHLGLLQQNPELSPGTKESLQEVERETLRAANLTRQLLLFSRRQIAQIEPVDLEVLIEDLLKMLRRLLGENIEMAFQDYAGTNWVCADAGMMEQLVMNLCINARDAMPNGGQLTLAVTKAEMEHQDAGPNPDAQRRQFVCLSVTDTGCGMDETVLGRIFEPFFTTKEVGKGTGLGLATVYGIVKQHQGWIDVESVVGQGSTFRVYLPAGTKPLDAAKNPRHGADIICGSETILLVEDEPFVRRMVALGLRKLGYAVLEAGTGVEALKVWELHHQKIALLFTDMIMPENFTGLDLAKRLKNEKASLKVVVSSGYGAALGETPSIAEKEFVYLPKPYSAIELAKSVRRCLDNS